MPNLSRTAAAKLMGAAAAITAAVIILLIGWSLQVSGGRDAEERLSLYWSRYAALYYENHGGWKGFAQELEADAPRYPDRWPFRIAFRDEQGNKLGSFVSHDGFKAVEGSTDRSKPIIVQGRIVGYSDSESLSSQSPGLLVWLLAIALAAAVFTLWMLWFSGFQREFHRKMSRLYALAQQLAEEHAGRGNPASHALSVDPADPLSAVEHALGRAQLRINKLETVRRTMVADIAHELRTPLSVMRTQLDNALYAGEPLPLAKTSALHDETIRMSKLVRDLQELALAETGHLPLEKQWFSFTELVSSVVEMLSAEAEDRGICIRIESDSEIRMFADQIRIRQAVVNLAGNAIRHARQEIRVRIQLDSSRVVFEVTDDGWGIEEEELPQLFDRFYRGKPISSSGENGRSSGLGLGLAIAKQYAEAHGGQITVSSKWGEGACFGLILPVIAE
ncbi:sensor histidine kinase [Paenibacillus mendelii]|uniref:histidine kinase n=1 Tax=Paenibacillus mendelii TaxID=206163 RepID=A0ABV6JHC9_9BACL|nr:HAMP domain-containing sensor histidine kinase [Paenibacillus mendelii]MCQ6558204.1 HAMP domain-containing histidine kinase [Paenibacillus mendelii]